MAKSRTKNLKVILLSCFLVRFVSHLVRAFGDFGNLHSWRQIDTLGVSYRYFLRWFQEDGSSGKFLPAILQSADGNGIVPMEFPFLNFVFAPFWIFGPFWGKVVIYLLLAVLVSVLCLKISRSKLWFAPAFLLLPTLSYGSDYLTKFIPDSLAMLFVVLAVLNAQKNKKIVAFVFCSLGLLIKPTSIVALAMLLIFGSFRKKWKTHLNWIVASIAIAGIYFTLGMKWILSFGTSGTVFYVSPRDPFKSLVEVMLNFRFVWDEFCNRLFFVYGLFVFLLGALFLSNKTNRKITAIIFGITILQFVTIAALDGAHVTQHDYYFMGLAPIAACLFYFVLRKTHTVVFKVMIAAVAIHAIELSLQNMNHERLFGFYESRKQCEALKLKNPKLPWGQGYTFRSSLEPYPALGLCFGERQGATTSDYGFYYSEDQNQVPSACEVIDRTQLFLLVSCKNKV